VAATLPPWPITIRVAASLMPAERPPAAAASTDEQPISTSGVVAGSATWKPSPAADAASESQVNPWRLAFFGTYAAVALLFLIRIGLHHAAARRLTGRAVPIRDAAWMRLLRECSDAIGLDNPPMLLRSSDRTMPMASGIRRPTILLPEIAETWTPDRRRAVLLHELAHVARRDCMTQLIAEIACAVYWFHPGVWWTARRLRIDRELACDDRVLAAGTEARSYAGHLLELAYSLGGSRRPALVVTMAQPRQLEGRLLALLDARRKRGAPGLQGQFAMLAVMTALALPVARVDAAIVGDANGAALTAAGSAAGEFPTGRTAARADSADAVSTTQDAASDLPGTWEARPAEPGKVHLRMSEGQSSSGMTIPIEAIEGLSAAQQASNGSPVRLSLRRDAGTFTLEGMFRGGVGAGTYTFAANPAFAAELQKRGIGQPSAQDQMELARQNVGLAFLDELASQGYTKPSIQDLVRAAQHGVSLDFLKGMGALGYRLGTLDPLINMRDHGVTPEFVRDLTAAGLPRMSADELVRVRDHGVTPEYIGELRQLGYDVKDAGVLVNARDHGVTPQFVKDLAKAGYNGLPLADLVKARDHGVNGEYARGLAELGYAKLSLEDLVNARDHGVTTEFARGFQQMGYRPNLADLVRARDHGVTPKYLNELKGLGYQGLALEEVVSLRDHGLSADKIRTANEQAGTRLSPDMLKRLH
jgi:beta-lactamase regulating signal transducer with metallopeptidase domain